MIFRWTSRRHVLSISNTLFAYEHQTCYMINCTYSLAHGGYIGHTCMCKMRILKLCRVYTPQSEVLQNVPYNSDMFLCWFILLFDLFWLGYIHVLFQKQWNTNCELNWTYSWRHGLCISNGTLFVCHIIKPIQFPTVKIGKVTFTVIKTALEGIIRRFLQLYHRNGVWKVLFHNEANYSFKFPESK